MINIESLKKKSLHRKVCEGVQILASLRRNKNLSLSPQVSNSVQSTHAVKQRLALPNLYISPRTLKHVLKTTLFVKTHLNPLQDPCFALVWQVFGFCDTQRCHDPHTPAQFHPHRDTITKLKIAKVHTCRNIQKHTHRCPDLHPLHHPPNPIPINTPLQNTKLQKYACRNT